MSCPAFIGSQRLFHLDRSVPPDQQREWLESERFRLLRRRQEDGSLVFDGPESVTTDFYWDEIEDREAFLVQNDVARLCVTVDAGIGKTKALEQIQYLRQTTEPGHLAILLESHELPLESDAFLGDATDIEQGHPSEFVN